MSRQAFGRRRAATAVEFALVAPILFFFVLGSIEVGRAFMVSHLLNNAARQGCRVGVPTGTSTAEIKNTVNDTLQAQGVSGTTTTVLVNGVETEAANAAAKDLITVNVSIPVGQFTWVPGGSFLSGSIGSKYSLHRE